MAWNCLEWSKVGKERSWMHSQLTLLISKQIKIYLQWQTSSGVENIKIVQYRKFLIVSIWNIIYLSHISMSRFPLKFDIISYDDPIRWEKWFGICVGSFYVSKLSLIFMMLSCELSQLVFLSFTKSIFILKMRFFIAIENRDEKKGKEFWVSEMDQMSYKLLNCLRFSSPFFFCSPQFHTQQWSIIIFNLNETWPVDVQYSVVAERVKKKNQFLGPFFSWPLLKIRPFCVINSNFNLIYGLSEFQ